jgi:hypothetical protein
MERHKKEHNGGLWDCRISQRFNTAIGELERFGECKAEDQPTYGLSTNLRMLLRGLKDLIILRIRKKFHGIPVWPRLWTEKLLYIT